jgi:AcrR family transcriptional regulator
LFCLQTIFIKAIDRLYGAGIELGRLKVITDAAALAIARDLFSSEGYSVSTRKLATAIGLSQATLVQRFGSKAQLFVASMLPPPLIIDDIVGRSENTSFDDIAVAVVQEVAARLPIILQLASNTGIEKSILDIAHANLEVPAAIASLVRQVAVLQQRGEIQATTEPSAIAEALLVAAHGFTLMMMRSTEKVLPVEAIRRFAATLSNIQHGA